MGKVEKVDWFCPKCNSYVSAESVTHEETHQICNTRVILEPLNQNNMTPKEEVKELIEKYQFVEIANYTSMFEVKECALILVDKIIDIAYWQYMESMGEQEEKYWKEVKQEIINL